MSNSGQDQPIRNHSYELLAMIEREEKLFDLPRGHFINQPLHIYIDSSNFENAGRRAFKIIYLSFKIETFEKFQKKIKKFYGFKS